MHFLYISFYDQEGVELLNTVSSVTTILSITSILIYLFLFIVSDTQYPYQHLITKLIVGICVFFGFFSMLRYLMYDSETLILESVFQLFLTDVWFFLFFLVGEAIIAFFVFVSFSPKYIDMFFPRTEKALVRREYLKFFALGTLLGGIGEAIKAVGSTLDFLIVGGFLNTIGLSITIITIGFTRKHLRSLAWQIIEVKLEEQKELDEIKNQLMDFASHEIRTPLSILWGNVELLYRDEDHRNLTKEKRQKIFKAIERNYQRIERLLDKSYDFSRLRRGLFELEKEWVDLWDLTAQTVKNMSKYVEKNNLKVEFITKKKNTYNGLIDPDRINQVLRNLIENAVKYSESGKIVISLSDIEDEYIISIKDEGRGIHPEQQERIFELHKTKELTQQSRGLGLGLYISKLIIELHQGRLWAESEGEGKGSTFFFSIPKNKEA